MVGRRLDKIEKGFGACMVLTLLLSIFGSYGLFELVIFSASALVVALVLTLLNLLK